MIRIRPPGAPSTEPEQYNLSHATTQVGLAPVVGSASTAMRSDSAPSLNQAIAPTWTGAHLFKKAVDSVTGFQIQDQDGNIILDVDSVNNRVGIGLVPAYLLDIRKSTAGVERVYLRNASADAAAMASLTLGNDTATLAGALSQVSGAYAGYGGNNSLNLINILNAPLALGVNNTVSVTLASTTGYMGLGTATIPARLSLLAATTAAGGIDFGGDTTLYRSAANVLKTDDALTVIGALIAASLTLAAGATVTEISTSGTLGGAEASDVVLPTQKAVKTYVDTLDVPKVSKVYASDGDPVALSADASGNVGIGTAVPGAALDLRDGSFYLTDTDVTQPLTGVYPTAVFGVLYPYSGTAGGLGIRGLSDTDAVGLYLGGFIGSDNPADTTPAMLFIANKYLSAGSSQALAAAETAFQFRNGATTSIVTVLGSGYTGLGVVPEARLSLVAATTAAGGIDFGGDTTLYRSAANVLKTDDALTVTGALSTATSLALASGATVTEISTSGTLVDDSDAIVPTQKATKTYVDSHASGLITTAHTHAKLVASDGTPDPAISTDADGYATVIKLQVTNAANTEHIRFGGMGNLNMAGGGYPLYSGNAYTYGVSLSLKNVEGDSGIGMGFLSPMRTSASLIKGGIFVSPGNNIANTPKAWADFYPALIWDTSGNVGIMTETLWARLSFPEAATAAGGISFGGDTGLYRSAANVLKTDNGLTVAGALITSTSLALASGATVTEISILGTLGDNSDAIISTQKAVKTYVDTLDVPKVSKVYASDGAPVALEADAAGALATVGALTVNGLLTIGENNLYGSLQSIADNAVYSFIPGRTIGCILVYPRGSTYTTGGGLVVYRTSATVFTVGMVLLANTNVTTGVLEGTTGTDGKFTISCYTDGRIYLENRLGLTVSVGYVLFGY